ncbi:aminotransferase class I/II-fold pyridoxal phosphate-dependent enzyme [Actinoplanes sp. N902-109]|uniref:aminotransferase class I/II-fold pyridoxal phosphate-dependent enzyme n=1 Tax=Actinoplanes sp. (strain N902-109) TaxID=649831 RepID=UPI00032940AF|nr:aminotransferase class I/II-fold pyridoxal phosphate-dependent enzyme [Actinoplanes sp. N902-109]AGL20272.1 GntR family transcriptional regulator with aminotransferase domain-containing protein [Actinoplanes sp. N902-109]
MPEHYQVDGSTAAEISASMESLVRRGDWSSGHPLPPIRVLAETLRVSPATVAKAYQELRHRGVIETAGRRGTRVRSRPAVTGPRSTLRLPAPPGTLDLSTGTPDVRLLPALGPHLRAVSAEVGAPLGYVAPGAIPELAEVAHARFEADGVPMGDAVIAATNGALDAMERLFVTHLQPGDALAVEDPGWANLLDLAAALGLSTVPFDVDDEGPIPDSLSAALASGVRAVVITVRAQNPTGAAISKRRAAALRAIQARHPAVLLIEDDHAAELSETALHSLTRSATSWAFIRSASKPFGPDLRVAVMAGDEATMGRVLGRLRIGSGWVSTVMQRLMLRLWREDPLTDRFAQAVHSYEQRRQALRDALHERGVEAHASTGINVWVRVPDETRAVTALRDAGYAVAPGSMFRTTSPPGIRMTVSPLDQRDIEPLADAVARATGSAAVDPPGR